MTASMVLVADPDPLARAMLAQTLKESAVAEVIQAGSLASAMAVAASDGPDIALVAERFPGPVTSLQAVREIVRLSPRTRVVILGLPDERPDVLATVRAGAAGYLVKDGDPLQLVAAVRRLLVDGISPLSPSFAASLLESVRTAHTAGAAPDGEPLTGRELDVLRLIALGLCNREIALRLGVTAATVKTHVHNLLSKLHLTSRVQLALYASERRLPASERATGGARMSDLSDIGRAPGWPAAGRTSVR